MTTSPYYLGFGAGLTGLLIATLGTDALTETVTLQLALMLIVTGIVAVGGSLLIDLRQLGSDDPPEVTADG